MAIDYISHIPHCSFYNIPMHTPHTNSLDTLFHIHLSPNTLILPNIHKIPIPHQSLLYNIPVIQLAFHIHLNDTYSQSDTVHTIHIIHWSFSQIHLAPLYSDNESLKSL
eukprot:NODE_742_length_4285_cov_0.769470.p4 type:complete len:109 gc:universal NODE_742_length_4285_cov_0.769470:3654-3980(+)